MEFKGHTLRGCVDWNSDDRSASRRDVVTPCVGVWIETFPKRSWRCLTTVTPCVGVWIETILRIRTGGTQQSHTLRGCVDWNHGALLVHDRVVGHTLRGCVDWNFIIGFMNVRHFGSHPAWVCGLKHCSLVGQVYGRIVSIRPLVYFSSSCYKIKSQTKYVRLLTLLWLEKTRTIPDAYLLSVFFCGFT